MNNLIRICEKYILSAEEAALYFRIGINKIRRLISENKEADWVLWNGNRGYIKRIKFEQYLDRINSI